jgi:hypothetical protein
MNKAIDQKYYTDKGMEYEPMLCVGDLIEFGSCGYKYRGHITTVGKYWIDNTSGAVGSGSIRCPFGNERKIACT